MKHLIIIALLTVTTAFCYGQKVVFGYDKGGNRTTRSYAQTRQPVVQEVIPTSPEGESGNAENNKQKESVQDITEKDVKIYPNPTQGRLRVVISQSERPRGTMELFSLTGQRMLSRPVTQFENTLDITEFPAGTYLLRLTMGQQVIDKKIIKQ
ncbi:MAG: T9SS type A sorting domain-containing protein [Bacteroidales bacterium]